MSGVNPDNPDPNGFRRRLARTPGQSAPESPDKPGQTGHPLKGMSGVRVSGQTPDRFVSGRFLAHTLKGQAVCPAQARQGA